MEKKRAEVMGGLLSENTYHPDVLARTYGVLFLNDMADIGWANLVSLRNAEYARYLTPPDTAAGTAHWDWSIRTGLIAGTIDYLNEKWNRTLNAYILSAITAGYAKMNFDTGEEPTQ